MGRIFLMYTIFLKTDVPDRQISPQKGNPTKFRLLVQLIDINTHRPKCLEIVVDKRRLIILVGNIAINSVVRTFDRISLSQFHSLHQDEVILIMIMIVTNTCTVHTNLITSRYHLQPRLSGDKCNSVEHGISQALLLKADFTTSRRHIHVVHINMIPTCQHIPYCLPCQAGLPMQTHSSDLRQICATYRYIPYTCELNIIIILLFLPSSKKQKATTHKI